MTGRHSNRKTLILLSIAGLLILSGCWDIKDINHRALPILMGLQKKDVGYQVFLLIPESAQGQTNVRVVSDSGETINQTVDQISKNMDLRVDLLHLKVIVFERILAEQGLSDSISSFMRARSIPNKTLVAISEGDMEPLFEKLKTSSTSGGMEIYNYFQKNAGWTPQVAQTRVWQIYRSIDSYTRDVAIPLIKPGRTTAIESTGSAIIKQGKMVDRIGANETLLYNVFNEQGAQGKIEVMDHATVQILTDRLSRSSAMDGNKAVLNSKLKLKVTILETKGNPTEKMIERELNELIAVRFQRMFRKFQIKEADVLGIGQFFRARIPRERLQKWRTDYYPDMQLNFQVHTTVENPGLLKMQD